MYKNLKNLFFVLVLSSFVFFNACGKKDQTSSGDKPSETTTEEPKQEVKTTQPESKSNELGIKEGLPADYPSDIPQPQNAKVLGSLNTSEGTVVTFESNDKPKDIYNQFSTDVEKNGYRKAESEQMKDEGGMAMWNKDKKEVSIMLAWDKEKSKSSIVITYK